MPAQAKPDLKPFQAWLRTAMEKKRWSKATLALNLGDIDQSLVGRWLREEAPSRPGPDNAARLERVFKTPPGHVYRMLGFSAPPAEPGALDLPPWLNELLPLLTQLTEGEGKTIEATAQSLLELRDWKREGEGRQS